MAGEHTMENVVMLAAMVKTSHLHMNRIASRRPGMQIPVVVSGKEAEMALKGALTTPGFSDSAGDSRFGRWLHGCGVD